MIASRWLIVSRGLSRLSDARAEEFRARLCALMEEFGEADQEPSTGGAAVGEGESDVQPYALTIVWEDGHDYGIYNWHYLRALCPCPEDRAKYGLSQQP